MDAHEFAEIFETQFSTSDSMLNSKRKEYAKGSDDVLHNFRMSAMLQKTNMRGALSGFLTKHIISLYDMMAEDEPRSMEVWDEKITDSINYLVLLRAIVTEELAANQTHGDFDSSLPSVTHINMTINPVKDPEND